MDADDRRLFETGLRQAAATNTARDLDLDLNDLGWRDALASSPGAATAALFAVLGETNTSSSALDDVVLSALGVEPAPATAVVLPALGRTAVPGRIDGGRLTVDGVATRRIVGTTVVVLVADTGSQDVLVRMHSDDVDVRPVTGMDPDGGWVRVLADVPAETRSSTPSSWSPAVSAGQLALAQELVGTARAMLQLARDHAVARIQFGRPIGSFQAVRHRLAESLVAVEGADAVVAAGWEQPNPVTAALAKAVAGRATQDTARHAQQVLAGMGFTTEHPFHRYLRRALVLDQLLGDGRRLSAQIGAEALRTRQLPAMLTL
jgi:hypothetical protein